MPVAVLGDGGVQQAVPVAGDGTGKTGGREVGQLQNGPVQNLISLPECGLIQNGGADEHGTGFIGIAGQRHIHHIAHPYLAHRQHLGKTVGLTVKLVAVEPHSKIVALTQIQINAHKSVHGDLVLIVDPSAGTVRSVGAVAAGGHVGYRGIRTGDGQHISVHVIPDIILQSGSGLEKLILEGEVIILTGKGEICQFRFCQEAQGKIYIVFQQMHIAVAVQILEIGIFLHLSGPLYPVLDAQEQVGNGGTFLVAVAVIGVFCTVSQTLHELRHLYIGRTGEGGDAVVIVQSAVVKGLGVGGLGPEERFFPFPLMHIADHGSSILFASGVEGGGGTGESSAEINEIQHHLQGDNDQQKTPEGKRLKGLGILSILFFLFRDSGLPEQMGIQQHKQIQQQERTVVGQVHGVQPGIGAGGKPQGKHPGCQDLPDFKFLFDKICPVSHIQQHKAVKEAEPVGDHVGKMEAVPDIVQLADNEADIEKGQQEQATDLVPQTDPPVEEEQNTKGVGKQAAVNIRQTFLKAGFQAAVHIAGNLAHGVQEASPGVFVGDVQPESFRETVDTGLGGLQGGHSGQLQECGHTDGQGGEQRHQQKIDKEFLKSLPATDLIAEEAQQHKNAGEQANVIIGQDRQKQAEGVQQEFALGQKAHHTQHDERQQGKGIQPHDVPQVSQRPGAQAVKTAEQAQPQILFVVDLLQKQGKEHTGQAQFQRHQERKIGQSPALGQKYAK